MKFKIAPLPVPKPKEPKEITTDFELWDIVSYVNWTTTYIWPIKAFYYTTTWVIYWFIDWIWYIPEKNITKVNISMSK